jgi:copper resistance protein B
MNGLAALAGFCLAISAHAQEVDHSKMDHANMDHSKMDHSKPAPPEASQANASTPKTPLPEPTEAEHAAAFPVLKSQHAHAEPWIFKASLDQFEFAETDASWEGNISLAKDTSRFLLRSSGERSDGRLALSDTDALFARSISPWWEVVAGVNQYRTYSHQQTSLAFGFVGMAPYKFEVEATAYLANAGQSRVQLAVEYQTLLSQRLILEPKLEAEFYGRDNPALGWGSGLGEMQAGLRLRYEITRQFAPYAGIVHTRYFGKTADYLLLAGEAGSHTEWVFGLHAWF